jgi:hypothetical protein
MRRDNGTLALFIRVARSMAASSWYSLQDRRGPAMIPIPVGTAIIAFTTKASDSCSCERKSGARRFLGADYVVTTSLSLGNAAFLPDCDSTGFEGVIEVPGGGLGCRSVVAHRGSIAPPDRAVTGRIAFSG